MKQSDFLAEFDDEHFPSPFGPWLTRESHDPPFTFSQLSNMRRAGIIDVGPDGRYRLTLKATTNRPNKADARKGEE